jgi:hypothetical protein
VTVTVADALAVTVAEFEARAVTETHTTMKRDGGCEPLSA